MDRKRILIADASREFRDILADTIQSTYQTHTTWDGVSTLQQLHSFQPDILVLDLMMPGLDGITLLQKAAADGLQPMVLATTRYLSDYIVSAAEALGVGYLMVKPCDIGAVAARIADMSQRIQAPVFACPDSRVAVSNVLLRLGVPTKVRGYTYLREAVLLMANDPSQSITKELYPAVASACAATAVQVERSIRSAIGISWERRDDNIWRMYFGTDHTSQITRPTNGAFISRLADHLNLA